MLALERGAVKHTHTHTHAAWFKSTGNAALQRYVPNARSGDSGRNREKSKESDEQTGQMNCCCCLLFVFYTFALASLPACHSPLPSYFFFALYLCNSYGGEHNFLPFLLNGHPALPPQQASRIRGPIELRSHNIHVIAGKQLLGASYAQ